MAKQQDILEELVEIINKKEILANQEVTENSATYRVRLGKKKRAEEDLKEHFNEYKDIIKDRSAFILVTGDKSVEFSNIAKESFGCFTLEADGFYKDMANNVSPTLYTNYTASPHIFNILESGFAERAIELGISSHPRITFKSKYKKLLKNREDMVELSKRAFNDCIGAELVGLDSLDKVAKQALSEEEKYAGKVVPIILHTEDEGLVEELLLSLPRMFRNVFVIDAGKVGSEDIKKISIGNLKSVTEDSVGKVLTKIRKNL